MPNADLRALTALHRLRRVETGEARRALAGALARQMELTEWDNAIGTEIVQARDASGDFDRETFSVWLERMRTKRLQLADAIRSAETATRTARADLGHRRMAETAIEEMLAGAMTARDAALARRDQVILEDAARALKTARSRDQS